METFFVFGAKTKESDQENVIHIGQKSKYKTLLHYLIEEKKIDPYDTSKSHLMIPYFSDDDCFISYIHDNPLELRLEEVLIPRESIVITGKKHDIEDISINKFEYEENDYDIFSGEEIPEKLKHKDYIMNVMRFFSKILYQMLDCGYLKMKNIDKVEDWVITFQEPILDIFIRYHRMETSAEDMTVTDEYLINPKFRYTICIMMMKIISNFLVSNNIVENKEIKKFNSWENEELWNYLSKNLSFFK